MKKINNLLLVLLFTGLAGCKKERSENVTVVRDCTGTYLRLDGKDFQVCNLEKVKSFANGDKAKARFNRIEECNGSAKDAFVCEMLHPSEGWVEVVRIR